METTPDSAPPARRLKLRLLICNPKSYGSKNIVVKGRGGDIPRTREDPYLPGLHSYECKTHTEWRDIGVAISKQVSNQNCLFAYAHFVDLDQPAGAAARVELVPGGIYADGSADTPAPIISKSQEGSEPSEAHNLGEGGSTPPPATISPPMDEDSQSGSAGEALEESESTLSTDEARQPAPSAAPPAEAGTPNSKPKPPAKPAPAAKKKK